MNEENIRRAYNIIWDFSSSYNFKPKYYEENDILYKNMIYGAMLKYFDFKRIAPYFKILSKSPFKDELIKISLIFIEHSTYEILKNHSLTIENLRLNYAKRQTRKFSQTRIKEISTQIENIFYTKVLGKTPKEGHFVVDFYRELFDKSFYDTDLLIAHLERVFDKYFHYEKSKNDRSLMQKLISGEKIKSEDLEQWDEDLILDQFAIGSAEFTSNIYFKKKKKDNDKHIFFSDLNDQNVQSTVDFIENFYGKSIMPQSKLRELEKDVCVGIHTGKSLHFANGNYPDNPNAKYYEKSRALQKKKNEKYIEKNYVINKRAVSEISTQIKSILYRQDDFDYITKKTGLLNAKKAWHLSVLNKNDAFYKRKNAENNRIYVDLLLDSSASRNNQQEIIANQAYIIAQSMDASKIPIRIFSYNTLKDHTVFNLFRDYDDFGQNERIKEYYASGSNRDGLGFSTINHLIDSNDFSKHILIILTDGKPHDEKLKINNRNTNSKNQYVGKVAVDDSAKQIRKLKNRSVSILAVFTGKDEDLANAKKIYNNSLCQIKTLDNFSKIVSLYLKNELTFEFG